MDLCFGLSEHRAPGCFDVVFAVLLAVFAAVIYEFVAIPLHACRISRVEGKPYRSALWHAWTHQFWCCAKRHRREARDSVMSFFTAQTAEECESGLTLDSMQLDGALAMEAPLLAAAEQVEAAGGEATGV